MRTIGIDARVLVHRPTGVARYLGRLVESWPEVRAPAERLVLFVDRAPATPIVPPGPGAEVRTVRWPLPGGDPAWRQLRLPVALLARRPDVLFCPFYTVPLATSVPRVVTIHDVSFAAHPEWFTRRARAAFALAGPSARAARRVLTVSEFSAGEIAARLGVPGSRIDVVPPGIEAAWSVPVTDHARSAVRAWLGVDGPYVLHLGAVHARRCPELMIRAFARVAARRDGVTFVVAGPALDVSDPVAVARGLGIEARVKRVPWVPEDHLRALIAEARAVLYLSLYEGFGLPALEAMATGTPVVALRRASLPEVLGDAAAWVHAEDAESVADALDGLLGDERAREDLARAGRARAARFDPRGSAARTFEVLRGAA